jgi:hypothetical protein
VIRRIAPVLWLFAAAILIGACIGLSARANAEPFTITDIVAPPSDTRSPCLWWPPQVCPDGFTPTAVGVPR